MDIKDSLKDWIEKNQIKKYEIISESHVYFIETNSSHYYLKRLKNIREFHIVDQLQNIHLKDEQNKEIIIPTFQKGILVKSSTKFENIRKKHNKEYLYLLSEEIKGKDLYHLFDILSVENLKNIIDTIMFSLRIVWEKIGFVHGDLHLGNIILQKIDHPITLRTTWTKNPKDLLHPSRKILDIPEEIVVKDYLPVIIDFDRSITNDLDGKSNILNDIWHLLGILSLYMNNQQGELILDYIENFIDRYEFQEKKESFLNQWFHILP